MSCNFPGPRFATHPSPTVRVCWGGALAPDVDVDVNVVGGGSVVCIDSHLDPDDDADLGEQDDPDVGTLLLITRLLL